VSYKAPQLKEITGGALRSIPLVYLGLKDPFRGGEPVSSGTFLVAEPNPNLKPETGDSHTLGIAYSSQALRGFEASLTYFDINISNYIAIPNYVTEVNNPDLYPGGVIRAPATPQDQQQGFLGRITQLHDRYFNFGDLHVAGIDADLSYSIETSIGQFTPALAIANIYKWRSALVPGSPLISYVSQATLTPGFAPRWKGTSTLGWKLGSLSASVAGRYLGRYKDYQVAVPNSNELGNSWIFDLNVRYEMGRSLASGNRWLTGAYAALGAVNLFDKPPPFSYYYAPYDPTEYDIRGRSVYAQLGVKW